MTTGQLELFRQRWAAGDSMQDIADELGYSTGYLYYIANKYRRLFPRRHTWAARRRQDKETTEKVKELLASGMTCKQAARELGISESMAYRIRRVFM